MTDQNEEAKAAEGEIVHSTGPQDMAVLKELIDGFAQPFLEVQKEETKRAQIIAGIADKLIKYVFWIVALIVGLAFAALFMGETQLSEKIVFALLGLMGGFGIARSAGK